MPPAGADFNGVLNLITASIRWAHGGGRYAFNSTFVADTNVGGYPQGAVLMSADLQGSWLSLNDTNSDNPDTGAGTKWVPQHAYGTTAITGLAASNVTLTPAQAAKKRITLAGTLTANVQIIFPAWIGEWNVVNNTTGAFTVTAKTSAGTGVALAAGQQKITGDGTNIVQPAESIAPATASLHAVQFVQVQTGSGNYAVDTGSANAYVASYTPTLSSVPDGICLSFRAANSNTGASMFNPNGNGANAILGRGGAALQGGEIISGSIYTVQRVAAANAWYLVSQTAGAMQVGAATASQHAMQLAQATGRLLNVQIFSAVGSATYTPTPGATYCIADVQGAGGQGGGSPACSASQNGFGTGGHSGARGVAKISLSGVSSIPITIGAGGSTGAAGASGQTGGTTSFGTYITCPGGAGGGVLGPTAAAYIGGNAAALPTPTFNGVLQTLLSQSGNSGSPALCLSVGTAISGCGGISPGFSGSSTASNGTGAGTPGSQIGSGGAGAFTAASGAAQVGGAGIHAQIFVYEYGTAAVVA
ncbi:MAG: hypothetical protein PW999_00840 [Paraburkholderia tropica]|nr:hypothetical protein [Paraburkholderia tropica]